MFTMSNRGCFRGLHARGDWQRVCVKFGTTGATGSFAIAAELSSDYSSVIKQSTTTWSGLWRSRPTVQPGRSLLRHAFQATDFASPSARRPAECHGLGTMLNRSAKKPVMSRHISSMGSSCVG